MARGIGRQLSHDVLEQYRFRAIELRKKKWKISAIAEAFGLHRRAVTRWLTQYRKGGKKALLSKKASGPSFKLTEQEMKDLLIILKDDAMRYGF